MKLKAQKAFCTGGGTDVSEGQEFDLPDHIGRLFVSSGQAVSLDDLEPSNPVTLDEIQTAVIEPINGDPPIKGRKK